MFFKFKSLVLFLKILTKLLLLRPFDCSSIKITGMRLFYCSIRKSLRMTGFVFRNVATFCCRIFNQQQRSGKFDFSLPLS